MDLLREYSKITLLTNENDGFQYFTRCLSEAMQRKGFETRILQAASMDFEFWRVATNPHETDLTVSFNSFNPLKRRRYFWESSGIPHLHIRCDPVSYVPDMIRSDSFILTSPDRFECERAQELGAKNCFFLPHAVDRTLSYSPEESRPYDVVFIGTCFDHEAIREHLHLHQSPLHSEIVEEAIHKVLTLPEMPLFRALTSTLSERKMLLDPELFKTLHTYVDFYTRGKERHDLIASIKGCSLHIFGGGWSFMEAPPYTWNKVLAGQKNVIIHPQCTFLESFEILKKSKITLNCMPFFKNGSHERLLNGLACGALPLTMSNPWVEENFIEGQDLATYPLQHFQGIEDKVHFLLTEEAHRQHMVALGRQKVMAAHTWDHRVDQIFSKDCNRKGLAVSRFKPSRGLD